MSTSEVNKTVGIFTGDPKGIGPEMVAALFADPLWRARSNFRLFGPELTNPYLSDGESARQTWDGLQQAIDAALRGEISVLVTGPVNKTRLRLLQKDFIGMTEVLQARCGGSPVSAFFVAGSMRVALVTRHLALAQVVQRLNAIEILQTIRQTALGLQKYFAIASPRLGICGFNPHAGEGEMFGDEENRLIRPAMAQAKKEGIAVEGPLSPDTAFWQLRQGKWDAVVAMYHDQGLIPIKTMAFNEACQLTLGLPFLRISVDHGTAESLVGTGKADPSSLKTAIHLACELAANDY